jgi:hypothetical protein
MVFFEKISVFCKNWRFCKNRTVAEKFAKIRKKVFHGIRFSGEGQGNFAKIQSDYCKKSFFLLRNPLFAKFFLQTFSQCPPLHPHGGGGSNPVFSKIGKFAEFFAVYCKNRVFQPPRF